MVPEMTMPVDEIPLASVGLVDVRTWAKQLGRGVRAVQRWIEDGKVPAVIVGKPPRHTFLVRIQDTKNFTPPPVGRPPKDKPETKKPRKSRGG